MNLGRSQPSRKIRSKTGTDKIQLSSCLAEIIIKRFSRKVLTWTALCVKAALMIWWLKACNSIHSNNPIEVNSRSRTRTIGIKTKMKLILWTMTIGENGQTQVTACHIVNNIEEPNNHTSQQQTSSSLCRYNQVMPIVMEAVVRQDRSTSAAPWPNITNKTIGSRTRLGGYGIHSVEQLKVVAIERIINHEQSWNPQARAAIT